MFNLASKALWQYLEGAVAVVAQHKLPKDAPAAVRIIMVGIAEALWAVADMNVYHFCHTLYSSIEGDASKTTDQIIEELLSVLPHCAKLAFSHLRDHGAYSTCEDLLHREIYKPHARNIFG